MKSTKEKQAIDVILPCRNSRIIGHQMPLQELEYICKSDKIPQSWLFTGPKGVGKATCAYRFARYLLAGGASDLIENPEKLYVSSSSPTFLRVAGDSHSDLLVITADSESASGDIKIDEIRKINDFLRMTASETKNRIVIIDSADDLNSNAANALLKLLEEPPFGAIFILISHAPGKLLPTIKSRCRQLRLMNLSKDEAARVMDFVMPGLSPKESEQLVALSCGSPGVAVWLYNNDAIKLYKSLVDIINSLPNLNYSLLQSFSNKITGKDDKDAWGIFLYLLNFLIVGVLRLEARGEPVVEIVGSESEIKFKLKVEKTLAQGLKVWEKINSLILQTSHLNLDKKAVLISIFEELKNLGSAG